jgi:D-alanyl-D-alanine carboxypeptidase
MRRFLFLVFICGFLINVDAQQPQQYVTFRIDSAVKAAMTDHNIPGMQVAVSKYSLVLKKGKYGFANLEDRLAVTDSTLFPISFMSKAFTCGGILLLMEDGKLGIDDPISKYIDSVPDSWNGISLRRLMNNTSGLQNDWDQDDVFFQMNNSDSAFLNRLKNAPLKFQPGDAFGYSCGTFLLGLVIEKVSGMSYADFMKQRIFDKLGMTYTTINNPDRIIPNRAAGYVLKNQQLYNAHRLSAAAEGRGDIGVLTNVTDMLKWYTALLDSSLFKKSSLDLMFSPAMLNDSSRVSYGFGWFLNPYRDNAFISHGGSSKSGFNSVIEIYPEDHVVIIILSNRKSADVRFLAKDIVGLFNKEYSRASKMEKDPDTDSVRTMIHRHYFEDIGSQLDTGRKMMRALHMPAYLTDRESLAPYRDFTEFNFINSRRIKHPKADIFGDTIQTVCLYEVKYADKPTRYYSFLLNENNKIVFIDYEE